MIDLSTDYLGLKLKSPVVASASPLCEHIDNLLRMEDAGIAAAVLPSLFEEQINLESSAVDSNLSRGSDSFGESLNFFPEMRTYNLGPEGYLESIRKAKESVSIPIIASLNGASLSGWLHFAKLMQQAGADAIELNLYDIVTDPAQSASAVEHKYFEIVRQVKSTVSIPVAVKLSPFFTSLPAVARGFDEAGAAALVLFNRFYQPELDLETLDVVPVITLSSPRELLLRLHWTAILYGHVRADLAVTGGVHRPGDVLKSVMAGASVAMMTSALLQDGIEHTKLLLEDLVRWMEEHDYESIRQMRGSMSRRASPNPETFQRLNYMRVLSSYVVR
jgi:dihydroorotate dehydrogenase (fumarate)